MTSEVDKIQHAKWAEASPMKRIGRAEEVAKAVLFFASEESSYCNGSILTIDGGKSDY